MTKTIYIFMVLRLIPIGEAGRGLSYLSLFFRLKGSFLKKNTYITHKKKKVTAAITIDTPVFHICTHSIGVIPHRASIVSAAPAKMISANIKPIKYFITV